jgi:transposase
MSVSASETGKAESRAKAKAPRQYTEECRLEAVEYYRKAREADPKTRMWVWGAARGTNDTPQHDWVIKYGRTGKVTQARTDGQKEPGGARRHIREPGSENEFLKKAAAFFARSL